MKMGTHKNAVSCFTRGLHESIKNRMQNRHATNLQEAINSAVTIENDLECLANLRRIVINILHVIIPIFVIDHKDVTNIVM